MSNNGFTFGWFFGAIMGAALMFIACNVYYAGGAKGAASSNRPTRSMQSTSQGSIIGSNQLDER